MGRYYQFSIGDSTVTVLSDGRTAFPSPFLMIGVEESERLEACRHHQLDPDAVESNMNCILLSTAGQNLLFDTGAGASMPGCGLLLESLETAGIARESIDQVIHTHLHLDHVGNNVDESGRPTFPNARYLVGRTEWEFWSSDETLAALERSELWNLPDFEPAMAQTARNSVLAISDRVDIFADDGEPVSGVRAVPAFGHTPGHLSFEIDVGSETLFITGDLALSPFHIDHARWFPAVDLDPETAVESRARVFNAAADAGALAAGYHLPFPGIGRMSRGEDGWDWVDEFALTR